MPVQGETTYEGNEQFRVTLSNASTQSIVDTFAIGTITEDEGPVTSEVMFTENPVAVGTTTILMAYVDETNTGGSNILSAEYSVEGDGFVAMTALDSGFDEVSEDVMATLPAFDTPGVYEVCVRGTDVNGHTGLETCSFLVVYDSEGGFVTGGGFIYSEPRWCYLDAACAEAEGNAHFGFVSKYQKGATVPTGETEFQFKAGSLNFHSAAYDWLVVAGARAQYKGVGTINGVGSYRFLLTAYDADVNKTDAITGDRFRMKIWDDDGVIYDNGLGADEFSENQLDATPLGGGSIVIHSGKGK